MFCAENFWISNTTRRRPRALAARPARARRTRQPIGPGPTSLTPQHWFLQPLRKTLKKLVRPPTSRTRRRLLEVQVPLPRDCLESFMAPVLDGDAVHLRDLTKRLSRDAPTGMLVCGGGEVSSCGVAPRAARELIAELGMIEDTTAYDTKHLTRSKHVSRVEYRYATYIQRCNV